MRELNDTEKFISQVFLVRHMQHLIKLVSVLSAFSVGY